MQLLFGPLLPAALCAVGDLFAAYLFQLSSSSSLEQKGVYLCCLRPWLWVALVSFEGFYSIRVAGVVGSIF